MKITVVVTLVSLLIGASAPCAFAQAGTVSAHTKISDTAGGFAGALDDFDFFGGSIAHIGDLDGDLVSDIAVGAASDDDGGSGRGALWILFLNADGSVKAEQKISSTAGGFSGALDNADFFGHAIASLGDLDGDGVTDLAVSAIFDDDAGVNRGAVWILFLNTDGTVKGQQKISALTGGFAGALDDLDEFGRSVGSLGDLDGDGNPDLVVGARGDDDGGSDFGAVWVLFLNSDGTVASHQKISATAGGFTGSLAASDRFGTTAVRIGDLDADNVPELAVGAPGAPGAHGASGALWVLFLNGDGTVKADTEISDGVNGFSGVLDAGDAFGGSASPLGDVDGDGVTDLAVGAYGDDDAGGFFRGAVWIVFLNLDGSVDGQQKINDVVGNFGGTIDDNDVFGTSAASLGDLDGDGKPELAVGAPRVSDGGVDRGAVWILSLEAIENPWIGLGQGLAGISGVPNLTGAGTIEPSTTVTLTLGNARPSTTAALIIGASAVNLTFQGGTLVPSLDLFFLGLAVDGDGSLQLSGTWPASAPSGLTVHFQYWIDDDTVVPFGYSASNGLSGTSP